MDLLKTWNMYNYSAHKNVSVEVITTDFLIEELGKHDNPYSMDELKCSKFEQETSDILIKYAVHWNRLSDVICYWTRILKKKKKRLKSRKRERLRL